MVQADWQPPSCWLQSSPLLSPAPHSPLHGPESSPGIARFWGQTWFQNKFSGERTFLSLLRSNLSHITQIPPFS